MNLTKSNFLKRMGNLYALGIERGYTEYEMMDWAEDMFQLFKSNNHKEEESPVRIKEVLVDVIPMAVGDRVYQGRVYNEEDVLVEDIQVRTSMRELLWKVFQTYGQISVFGEFSFSDLTEDDIKAWDTPIKTLWEESK